MRHARSAVRLLNIGPAAAGCWRARMKRAVMVVVGVAAFAGLSAWAADAPLPDGPRYNGTSMVRPANYREWTFLASGLGMTYDPSGRAENAPQFFTNVFANPSAYKSFS